MALDELFSYLLKLLGVPIAMLLLSRPRLTLWEHPPSVSRLGEPNHQNGGAESFACERE